MKRKVVLKWLYSFQALSIKKLGGENILLLSSHNSDNSNAFFSL